MPKRQEQYSSSVRVTYYPKTRLVGEKEHRGNSVCKNLLCQEKEKEITQRIVMDTELEELKKETTQNTDERKTVDVEEDLKRLLEQTNATLSE